MMNDSVNPTHIGVDSVPSTRMATQSPPSLAPKTAHRPSPRQRLLAALTGLLPRNLPASNRPSGVATSPSLYKRASRALSVTAFLAALAVGLLFLLPGGLLWAQDADTIEYPENGTGAVATYTAEDPEGKSVTWSMRTEAGDIDGDGNNDVDANDVADSGLFKIGASSGVLTFMESPDYEDPQGGTANNSNTYMVVVAASDGAKTAYEKVEVEVTNDEEEATTGIEMSSLQPQVSTEITVAYVDGAGNPFVDADGAANDAIVDPDQDKDDPTSTTIPADDVEWQWSRSSSQSGTFADIPGDAAKAVIYTPDSGDAGMYLRVTGTYEDGEGEDKSVEATSAYPVREFQGGNSVPAFPEDYDDEMPNDQGPAAEVDDGAGEGETAGDPVTANDANSDRLTYSLEAAGTATHADLFQIDRMTGQVTVGLGRKVNPASDTASQVPTLGKGNSFTVTIKATDPSGGTDTVVMTITVDEVDEAPVFTADKASHSYAENGTGDVYDAFAAYDPEDATPTFTLSGEDATKLSIDSISGVLTFGASPNFEARGSADGDNVYEVTVKAAATSTAVTDATEKSTTVDVTVEVTNEEEPGSVTLSASQPRIGVEIMANMPTDPDGGVTDVTWQWSRADNAAFGTDDNVTKIKDATMAGYTPVSADDGKYLRVTASYTDAEGSGKTAVGMPADSNAVVKVRNLAPMFTDEDDDTAGIQVDDREVGEDADAGAIVGAPVVATDDADAETGDNDAIFYLLSGADAAPFDINSETGQITVGANAKLNHEAKDTYMVTVMARDLEGLSSSVDVTIEVTDVDEAPDISGPSSEMYAENGEGTVAVFTAMDPEGKSVTWSMVTTDPSVTGIVAGDFADSALFKISESGGDLTFMDSPDYEDSTRTSNTYMVVVGASDGAVMGYQKVEVEVTNVEESATTGIEMSSLQPQVSTPITVAYVDEVGNPFVDARGAANAAIEDPDMNKAGTAPVTADTDAPDPTVNTIPTDDVKWQWSRSSSQSGTFADIPGDAAKMVSYTPDSTVRNLYLRVTGTYEDGEGEDKSVVATSMYRVRAFQSGNSAPAFPDDFDSVMDDDQLPMEKVDDGAMEGDDAGDPVTASDPNNDRLTYSLEAADTNPTDADVFQIDRMTGQVTVGLGKTVSPADDRGEPDSVTKQASFTVTIKATDPHGSSDTVVMTITSDEVDEAPVFTDGKTSHSYKENTTANTATDLYTFMAYDPEEENVTYSVSGDDASKLSIVSSNGVLTFNTQNLPDFEARGSADGDNVYEVTVKASDAGTPAKSTTVDVTVEVTNEEEPGSVTLSASQPRIGVEIRANMPTDPDGGVTDVTWQWSRADNAAFDTDHNVTKIKDATNAGYTPVVADAGKYLRVTATYTDAEGSEKTAVGMPADPNVMVQKVRNLAPVFTDEDDDTAGIQIDPREVEEDADAGAIVGAPVGATDTADADDGDDGSILYLLSGADAASFDINSGTGQIMVGASAMLDHETNPAYEVTVTARDPEGLSSSVDVTIKVTDVNEAPEIMRVPDANVAPEFASTTTSRTVAENTVAGEDIGTPVAANDANGDALTYALSGTDDDSFDIDPGTGQLMTLAALDYETKPAYSVTVTASDSGGLSDSIDVTITVTDVDDVDENVAPEFADSEDGARSVAEDTAAGEDIGAPVAATDADNDALTYVLSGIDAASFDIISDTGQLRTEAALDYDTKNSYAVTVTATDGHNASDSIDVTITVTEVVTGDGLVDRYDADDSGEIDKTEVLTAINDYLFGEGDEAITKPDVLRLINLYLFGS